MEHLLGYSRGDMIGSNITKIIPYEKLRNAHKDIIVSYIQNSEKSKMGGNHEIIAQDKQGFLITINMSAHIVPYLDQGISLMIFLLPRKQLGGDLLPEYPNAKSKDVALFLLDPHYNIQAFNKKSIAICGLKPSNVNPFNYHTSHRKISMRSLYPEIFCSKSEIELFSFEGKTVDFCADQLKEAFLSEALDYNAQGEVEDIYAQGNIDNNFIHHELSFQSQRMTFRAKNFELKISKKECLQIIILSIYDRSNEISEGQQTFDLEGCPSLQSSVSLDWRGYYLQDALKQNDMKGEIAFNDDCDIGSVSGSSSIYTIYI